MLTRLTGPHYSIKYPMKSFKKQLLVLLILIPVFLGSADIAFADEMGIMAKALWALVTSLFGMLLWMGGWVLDIGITDYVVGFGDEFASDMALGIQVNALWVVIRDLFNITFIFGLVYIGLKMILDSDDTGTKKMLGHLILAALLINFSLYITQFIVDFTNILATQIAAGFEDTLNGTYNVSGTFMDVLGITTAFEAPKAVIHDGAEPYGYIFGTAIVCLVGMFVFGAGGILLLIRYVLLILFMILSPLMFLGFVFPGLQSISSLYWKKFIGQAFFAPIYILFLYFSVQILNATLGSGDPKNLAEVFTGGDPATIGATFSATIPPFIISCIFLVASLVIAQKMGAVGAGHAVSMGKSAAGRIRQGLQRGAINSARFATTKPAGWVARRGSNALGQGLNRQLTKLQASDGLRGKLARTRVVDSLERGAHAKLTGAKFGLSETQAEVNKRVQTQRNEIDTRSTLDGTYNTNLERINNSSSTEEAVRNAQNAIGGVMRNPGFTNEQLLAVPINELQSPATAAHLNDTQIKALQDSGKYTNEQIKDVRKARDTGTLQESYKALDAVETTADGLNTAFDQLGRTIRGLSNERVQGMGHERLTNERVAMNLTDGHFDHLQSSGQYTEAQMGEIRDARKKGQIARATGSFLPPAGSLVGAGNAAAATDDFIIGQRRRMMSGNVKEMGQLPVEVFTDKKMAEHITPQALEERMKNGGISSENMKEIEESISEHLMKQGPDSSSMKPWQKWKEKSTYGAGFNTNTSPAIVQSTNIAAAGQVRDANRNNYPH
ncbi:MAG: hypothetical protein ACI9BF_000200 [Candidatus Paceibacteria bacterium]|jgi:hypothetical protein